MTPVVITMVACVAVATAVGLCARRCHRMRSRVEEKAVARFQELAERYDAAAREAAEAAIEARRLSEEEYRLVAASARCVLWHARVEDRGEKYLNWDLRVFAEERGEFLYIHDVPPSYRVGAWYHGRSEADMFRLADNATNAIRGGAPGYTQEFQCKAKDGTPLWFQEDVRIEKDGPGHWRLFGVSMDITERKKAEEQRERLLKELQAALADVKQLRGMLPICASCKKIRDDAGYWNQIEAYLTDHADIMFSHGICPDCMKKLYPGVE